MPKIRKAAMILTLAASCVNAGAAQTMPAIVACDWESGEIFNGRPYTEIYRIAPGSWDAWSTGTWKWSPMACAEPVGTPSERICETSVSDSRYRHKDMTAYTYRASEGFVRYTETYSIDRMTGAARHLVSTFEDKGPADDTVYNGTCRAVPDPALQPRPKPKL